MSTGGGCTYAAGRFAFGDMPSSSFINLRLTELLRLVAPSLCANPARDPPYVAAGVISIA
jgi:hypothetical protein